MDNFKFTFVGKRTKEILTQAMTLAFSQGEDRVTTAEGYVIDAEKGLVFLWANSLSSVKDVVSFPFKMDAAGCADWAYRWLENADYGREPGHDGSNSKGFKIYNDTWSRVDGYSGSIVAVKPEWCWHGK